MFHLQKMAVHTLTSHSGYRNDTWGAAGKDQRGDRTKWHCGAVQIILEGQRDPEIVYDIEDLDYYGNIVEILDHTVPAYHYEQLYERNK